MIGDPLIDWDTLSSAILLSQSVGTMNRNDTIKRTSELLLSGWRMLATICPICHAPLLSKDGNMLCPGCNVPVRMENDLSSTYDVPGSLLGHEERKVDVSSVVEESVQLAAPIVPQSMEELRREYDIRNARRNKVSDQLGQHLLRGWVMLQQTCPREEQCNGTPLMRETADGPMLCLSCSTEYLMINDILVPALQASTVPEVIEVTSAAPSTINHSWLDDAPILPLSSFARDEKDSSWRISQKLMQGWRLLDEVCVLPNCSGNVPLMRDKNGKIHCVDCGGVDKVSITEAATTVMNTTSAPATALTIEDDDSIDEEEDQYVIDQLTQAAFRRTMVDEGAPKNKSKASDEQFALQILQKKLRAISTKLDSCDQSCQISELVELITKLATSIKAVKDAI